MGIHTTNDSAVKRFQLIYPTLIISFQDQL